MDVVHSRLLSVISTLLVFTYYVQGLDVVPDSCLDCLAVNQYNKNSCELHDTIAISHSGKKNLLCGVYKISPDYFTDCTVRFNVAALGQEFRNYENCAWDYNCARQCVNGYMKKFQSQCSGGVNLTCADFGRLHSGGPNGCVKSKQKDSEPTLAAMVEQCGCLAIYEDKLYCQLEHGTTTLSPKFLAIVIAVPAACFVLLVTVVVVVLLICRTRKSKGNVSTNYTVRRFDSLERNLDGTYDKPPTQLHLYGDITPSVRNHVAPQVTQTASTEHRPAVILTAQDGSISNLNLRDIVISPNQNPRVKESADFEPAVPDNSSDSHWSYNNSLSAGVYAEEVTLKEPNEYVNSSGLENDEEPTAVYENCVLVGVDQSNQSRNYSQLGPSGTRAPIPIPRRAETEASQER